MRPLTETVPKPLIKVGGRPMIDHLLDRFAQAGVSTAIVNVHHLADQIETHLDGRSAPHVVISDERDLLLDQGGAIKKALPLLGIAPFFLCNTDAFWVEGAKPNLERLARRVEPGRDGCVAARRRNGNRVRASIGRAISPWTGSGG